MMNGAASKTEGATTKQGTVQAGLLAEDARFLAELEAALAQDGTRRIFANFYEVPNQGDALYSKDYDVPDEERRPVCNAISPKPTIVSQPDDKPSHVTSTSTNSNATRSSSTHDAAVIAHVGGWISAWFVRNPGASHRQGSSDYKSENLPATWDECKDREKFFGATRAAERHGGLAWSLNLGNVVHRNAMKDASSGRVLRSISGRIRAALRDANLDDLPISFVIDVDAPDDKHASGKLHLHGTVILGDTDPVLFALAMRSAGGKMKTGRSNQFVFSKEAGELRRVTTP